MTRLRAPARRRPRARPARPRGEPRRRRSPPAPSCGATEGGGRFAYGHVADLEPGRDRAGAAVLEGDLGRDVRLDRAVIKRRHQRRVTLSDEAAADLQGARELAVVGIELL